MPKETRLKHELDNLCHTLSNIDSSLNSSCIHDFHRLGKFNPTSLRPRPLLVKFLRIYDATLLLSKRSSLPSPIVIKPDLTREERALDSAFLKIRWNLIQNGTDKKCIRLRGSNILINKLLYAKLVKSNDGSVKVNIINNQLTSTSQDPTHSDSIQLAPTPATNQAISSSSYAEPMITTGPPTPKKNQSLTSIFYINSRIIVNANGKVIM